MVRKTVTLVFCDVADSTRLGERLDPEALREVWSRYHAAARTVLERHGGTIEKFVGDAVMAVFGIPVVHEDDALRAVRAAAELRGSMAELNAELEAAFGVTIEIRTGVNTGEVVAGDAAQGQAFATGDPVVVAQRLEAAAGAGEILVADSTFRLVRDAVRAEALAPFALKGKSEAVTAWRLLDVEAGAAGVARRLDSPLVGRSAELARLGLELGRAKAERSCRTITIVGEPGVGKSRLAGELVASLGDEALALEGRCLPYGSGITYWPLVEIVRRLDLDTLLAGEADGELIRGRVLEAIGRAEPRSRSDELYWAVRRLLERLARERPVVLVLDDVQWAEPAFLDLVEYLAGWTRDAPVLVCCLARSEFAELRPAWPMLPLAPLAADDAARLLENLAGPLEREATRELSRVTAGNPLFLEEMVRMLAEHDRLVERDGLVVAELDALPVPETIQAVLAARLDLLPEDERDVIQRASVIGQVFWWGAVAELTEPERVGETAARLQALVRKGLIRPDPSMLAGEDGFRFAHLLVRDAAYDSMPKRLRAELHERFADWLEPRSLERPELDEILGHHLEQARSLRLELRPVDAAAEGLGDRAFAALARAGSRAVGRGDAHAASGLLRRAIALRPNVDPERNALLPTLALALTESGDLAGAEAVLDEAIEAAGVGGDERLELNARIERAALHLLSEPRAGIEAELALIEDALPPLAELGDERAQARGWFLIGLVRGLWAGRCAAAEAAFERALRHARTAGDRRLAGDVAGRLSFAAWCGPTPVSQAIDRCRELLRGANEDRTVEAAVHRALGGLLARRGDFAEARRLIGEATAAYRDLGMVLNTAGTSGFGYGDLELLAGNYVDAERELRSSYAVLERMGEHAYRSSVAAYLARALYCQGRYDEAERFTHVSEDAASEADMWSQILFRATRAKVLAQAGRYDDAVDVGAASLAIAERTDLLDLRASVHLDLAEALSLAARPTEAAPHIEQALELYEQKGNLVSAALARALLAETVEVS